MNNLTGQTIGNYRIGEQIGSGGMGQVFRGQHLHIDRLVAIKVLHDHLARDPGFQARFRQEATSIAALRHPNIVEMYDFGEQDGCYYLVLELLADGSLRSLLQRYASAQKACSLTQGLELVCQAADALAYAHVQGIIHRDIKPDNMLLRPASGSANNVPTYTLKLSDFGLARLAQSNPMSTTGAPLGTPAYMSPEQCQGGELDGRSDIYTLGVVLYEVTTGLLPFTVKNINEAVFKHVYTVPQPPRKIRPDIPAEIEAIILRCLAKKPADRYATANDLSIALQRALSNQALVSSSSSALGLQQQPPIQVNQPPANEQAFQGISQPGLVVDPLLAELLGKPRTGTIQSPDAFNPSGNTQTIGVALDHNTLELTPGQPATVRLTLMNNSKRVDQYDVSVEGVPKVWVRGPGKMVQLNPGTQTTVVLHVQAPRTSDSRAGDYPVKVCARSFNNPAELGEAPARWTVLPFTQGELMLTPARASGRGGATYTFTLRNNGNTPATYRMHASDDEQSLQFRFETDRLQLEPGQTTTRDLEVRAPRRMIGSAQPHAITVEAEAADHMPPPAGAQFSHRALIPVWVPPITFALLALLCFGIYSLLTQLPAFEAAPTFSPDNPKPGQAVAVHWRVIRAQTIDIQPEEKSPITGLDPSTGVFTFTQGFDQPTTIKLTARNRFFYMPISEQVTIGMLVPTATPTTEPGAPHVSFSIAPQEIKLGETITLNWAVTDAESVEIKQIGTVPSEGQQQDKPQVTTAYELVATSKSGKSTRRVLQVIVNNPTPQPTVNTPVIISPDAPPGNAPVNVPPDVPPSDSPTDVPPVETTIVPTTEPATGPTIVPTISKTITFSAQATGIITGNEAELEPLRFCLYAPTTQPPYPGPPASSDCPAPETGLQLWQPMIDTGKGLTSGISNSVTLIAIHKSINAISLVFSGDPAGYDVQVFDATDNQIGTAVLDDTVYSYHQESNQLPTYLKIRRQDEAPFWIAEVTVTMNGP